MWTESSEAKALLKDLVICVTSVFRDQDSFEALCETVVQIMFEA